MKIVSNKSSEGIQLMKESLLLKMRTYNNWRSDDMQSVLNEYIILLNQEKLIQDENNSKRLT